nr:MAG TPA: putative XkdM-like protein [Caudoviricetes sp.]
MNIYQGREYEWLKINVLVGGRRVTGLRGIEYTAEQEQEALYGAGGLPMGIQRGNTKYTGSITLTGSEFLMLRQACGGSILGASTTIVVCYGNPSEGDVIHTDTLIGCTFSKEETKWKQGDKFTEYSIPFSFLRLE